MIGEQIRYYRQEKHVKQEELADYLGVSFQAVSKWETGASTPDISLLPKLAVFFGISIDELFEIPYEEQMERIENMFWAERRINQKTFENAISFLENVVKNDPKDIRALSNLADMYNHRASSDHELASYYAQKVLELDPDEKAGWVAYLEANNGVVGDEWYDNHFEVIGFFKDFLEKNPMNYSGLYAVIENLIADHRYDEAMPYIEQMKQVRKNYQYLLYCGNVAFGKGKREEARTCWEQMIQEYPDEWQAYCSLGDGYRKLGEEALALEMYEKSYTMQESPRIYDGLCSMAQIYENRHQPEDAILTYERILDCLKTDYGVKEGEQLEQYERKIARLKKIK
jgi:transcriptional regulator with XRE-family HTH domain